MEFAVKRNCPGGGEPDILRTKDQLIERHDAGVDVIFYLGLIEMKFLQLLDLEQLPQRDEQAVLLDLTVPQNDFARAGERIGVGRVAVRLEKTFQLARDRPRHAASFRDNAVGSDVAELYAGHERRILRLRLNLEVARDLAVARARGDLRKLESGGIITHRRLEFPEEESVTQGCLGDADVSAQIRGGAKIRTEVDIIEGRDRFQFPVQETKSPAHQIDAANFRSEGAGLGRFGRTGRGGNDRRDSFCLRNFLDGRIGRLRDRLHFCRGDKGRLVLFRRRNFRQRFRR